MIKTRSELKAMFSNGKTPDQDNFGDLIDSCTNEDEFQAFVAQTEAALAQPLDLGGFPQATQWMGEAGRIGLYDPAGAQSMKGAAQLCKLAVPANGKWQVLLTALDACYAFELVACAQGAGKDFALLHAIALTTRSGKPCSIKSTHSYQGWCFLRRMRLRWNKNKQQGYDLQLKTLRDYGKDASGAPARIQYHLTRLW